MVTEPTGIMGMVAILFPPDVMVFEKPRPKTEPDQHAFLACHIFALAGVVRVQKIAAPRPCDEARTVPYKAALDRGTAPGRGELRHASPIGDR